MRVSPNVQGLANTCQQKERLAWLRSHKERQREESKTTVSEFARKESRSQESHMHMQQQHVYYRLSVQISPPIFGGCWFGFMGSGTQLAPDAGAHHTKELSLETLPTAALAPLAVAR